MTDAITVVRALMLIAFGVLTTFFIGAHFTAIASLAVVSFIPLPIIGVAAIAIGIGLLFCRTALVSYLLATMLTGVLATCSLLSLFTTAGPHTPTSLLFPIVVTAFVAGTKRYIGYKYAD